MRSHVILSPAPILPDAASGRKHEKNRPWFPFTSTTEHAEHTELKTEDAKPFQVTISRNFESRRSSRSWAARSFLSISRSASRRSWHGPRPGSWRFGGQPLL